MLVPRPWYRAAVALPLLLGAGAVDAAPSNEQRIAEVLTARIEMQRNLAAALSGSLAQPAQPFRLDPVVQVVLKGEVKELQQHEETSGGDIKFGGGGKQATKLPGLGYADTGSAGSTPEVLLRGPGSKTTRTFRQLEMQVVRLVVRLYVDPAMPSDRRELIRTLATDLAGIEPGRGDELFIEDLPGATALPSIPTSMPAGTPSAVVNVQTTAVPAAAGAAVAGGLAAAGEAKHGVGGAGSFAARGFELAVISLTAILAAAILSRGLSKRAQSREGARGEEEGAGAIEIEDGQIIDLRTPADGHAGGTERRREGTPFQALGDLGPSELADVLVEAEPVVAAAVIESLGLAEEASRLFHARATPERKLEIGLWLGKGRVISRAELGQMEAAAVAALARVRSRVAMGGAVKLASFLSAAPEDARKALLDGITTRAAAMAEAARGAMVLFGDLSRASPRSIRRVVTGMDPAVVALALVGAPEELRETVLGAVSKRLRGIIEGEAEAVRERPAKDVEAARRLVERSMFQLHARGELITRAA